MAYSTSDDLPAQNVQGPSIWYGVFGFSRVKITPKPLQYRHRNMRLIVMWSRATNTPYCGLMARRAKPKSAEDHHVFKSTRVDAAWYSNDTRRLLVEFVDGTRWVYELVDRRTFERFVKSGSAGRFVTDELDRFPNHPL